MQTTFPTRRSTLALLLSLASAGLRAQGWPARPVRIVIPNAPGGINDMVGRLLAARLQQRLGQPVLVENKPGGNGIIANDFVAKSPADGTTLLVGTTGSMAINAHLYPKLPYDPVKAFEPVGLLTMSSSVLAIHPSVPATTLAEFIAHAKAHPGQLNNSAGSTISQVAAELFKQMTGVRISSVPYKGSGPAVQGLLAGETQMIIADTSTVLPHAQGGRLKALAVTWPRRLESLPQVPTFPEAGMPGYEFFAWLGLFAPAGTPAAIVSRINTEVNAVLQMDDVRKTLGNANEAMPGPPEALAAAFRKDLQRFESVIRDANIKPE